MINPAFLFPWPGVLAMPIFTYKARNRCRRSIVAVGILGLLQVVIPTLVGAADPAESNPSSLVEVRIIPLSPEFAIGKPALISLELVNNSAAPVSYVCGTLAIPAALFELHDADAMRPASICPPSQGGNARIEVPPGERVTLVERFDLTLNYLITRPGDYSLSFWAASIQLDGAGVAPPSASLTVRFKPGVLRGYEAALKSIIPVCPPNWWVSVDKAATPPGDQQSASFKVIIRGPMAWEEPARFAGVVVYHVSNPTELESGESRVAAVDGIDAWGYVSIRASEYGQTLWPGWREALSQSLGLRARE